MQTRLAHYWILLSLSGFVSQIMIKYLCKLFALKNMLIIELGFKIMTIISSQIMSLASFLKGF